MQKIKLFGIEFTSTNMKELVAYLDEYKENAPRYLCLPDSYTIAGT
ncbi:MAG: hypothetical protein HC906_04355 [Bacteroidales bacterium]|nr:hypothetical protein [Bacteroidales bacterium]